jgi:hypothetical protein
MVDWIVALGGLAFLGGLVFFWVQWSDQKCELLSHGKWHYHLE